MTTPAEMSKNAPPAAPAGRRILLVDDNPEIAQPLKELLELEGHQVATETDPLVALQRAHTLAPEICILDIDMPVMDGYELAKRLRELPRMKDALYIAMTGYGWEHDSRRSHEAGFAHHMVKPVDTARLSRLIRGASVEP